MIDMNYSAGTAGNTCVQVQLPIFHQAQIVSYHVLSYRAVSCHVMSCHAHILLFSSLFSKFYSAIFISPSLFNLLSITAPWKILFSNLLHPPHITTTHTHTHTLLIHKYRRSEEHSKSSIRYCFSTGYVRIRTLQGRSECSYGL